jgi:Ni/Co efflux regulator RcnB
LRRKENIMKRLMYGLAAASLIASPVAQAQSDNHRDQRRGQPVHQSFHGFFLAARKAPARTAEVPK